MGNFQSMRTRFLGCRSPDEEEEGGGGSLVGYPNVQNEYRSNEESILVSFSSIYKATKAILQKAVSVVVSTKSADPSSLPIQNPLLGQIWSRGDSSSHSLLVDTVGSLTGDQQAHVVSVPEIGCSNEIEVGISPCLEINSSRKSKEKVKRSIAEKRIKHYSSWHKILLVGEGDFSFSACLALAFGSAANIIASSLDSHAFLKEHYRNAMSNIEELRRREGKVMHGINAKKMANHELLGKLKFDRIIYNFPYAGFFGKSVPKESQLSRHRKLVSKFLMNAKNMLSENGEIHITHKTNGFHADFKVESLASSHGLKLIEAVKFKCGDYPGYNTKYGFGGDGNFDCNPSKTFKFGLKSVSL
ncbi:uncharacterized protein At4g26485-like [Salvia splendens]|nr:uncharacterized protein At4g26485-like [Salvia splendens]